MALSCKLLAFTKNTGTGVQAVTGAGFTVEAGILFTANATALTTFQDPAAGGFGIGLISSGVAKSMEEASADAAVTSAAVHVLRAAKALCIMNSAGTVTAEASLTSLDSDGFTIDWTTNDGVARTIYALLFGGADLTASKVIEFQLTGGLGNKVVTGVGFVPDLTFLIRGFPGATSFDGGSFSSQVSIGVMDAAGNQWALSTFVQPFASPPSTLRAMFSDCAITDRTAKATFVSMDSDGFTLNVAGTEFTALGTPNPIAALCLKGGTWKAGFTSKPTGGAPASQAITGFGVAPKGLFLAGIQRAGSSSAGGDAHAELGVGAASSTTARGAIARIDRNAANPTISKRYSDSTKIFVKVDNGTPAVDAAADLTSFDSDGFTLSWNPNDAVATNFGWFAGGDAPPPPSGGNAVFGGQYQNRPFMRGGY